MGNQISQTYNEELPNSAQESFTSVYRKKGIKFLKETPSEDIRSIADLLRFVRNRHTNANGISTSILTQAKSS